MRVISSRDLSYNTGCDLYDRECDGIVYDREPLMVPRSRIKTHRGKRIVRYFEREDYVSTAVLESGECLEIDS